MIDPPHRLKQSSTTGLSGVGGTLSSIQKFDRARYAALTTAERKEWITTLLKKGLCEIGGFDETNLDLRQTFLAIGVDSLMAVRWRNEISRLFHLQMTLSSFLAGGNLESLVQSLLLQLDSADLTSTSSETDLPLDSRSFHNAENEKTTALPQSPESLQEEPGYIEIGDDL